MTDEVTWDRRSRDARGDEGERDTGAGEDPGGERGHVEESNDAPHGPRGYVITFMIRVVNVLGDRGE